MRRSMSLTNISNITTSTPLVGNISTPLASNTTNNLQTPNIGKWEPFPINFSHVSAISGGSPNDSNSLMTFLQNIINNQQYTIKLLAEQVKKLDDRLQSFASKNDHAEPQNKVPTANTLAANSSIPEDSFSNGTKVDDFQTPRKCARSYPPNTWQPDIRNSFASLYLSASNEGSAEDCEAELVTDKGDVKIKTPPNSNPPKRRPQITTTEKHLTNYTPPKLVPGKHQYSHVAKEEYRRAETDEENRHKPTVAVFGDSIPKRVSAYHLSNETGTRAKIRSYPGADSCKLNRHMAIEIENNAPEIAIVHVGSNDLANKVPTKRIMENMKDIVRTLQDAGTNYIFISGLIGRKDLKRGEGVTQIQIIPDNDLC